MNEVYSAPEIEVIALESADVFTIADSGDNDVDTTSLLGE